MDPEKPNSSNPLSRVPNYTLRDNSAEAMKRLGVELSKIGRLPPINKILRETKGGVSAAIEAMRFSDGELSQKFLDRWDEISDHDKERLTIEVVAFSCDINPMHLFGEIQLAMREYSVNAVKLIAVEAHPDVMRQSIESAKTPGGVADRKHIHEMLGALATPKGPMFIKNFFAGNTPDETDDEDVPAKPEQEFVTDEDFVFPDCEAMQERVHPVRKLLEASSTARK